MSKERGDLNAYYSKPPIIEAVIAIHFASPLPIKWLQAFAEKNKKVYPSVEEINSISANFDMQANKFGQSSSRAIGRRLFNNDRNRAIMFFESQISVCHLAPYLKWEDLYSDTQIAFTSLRKIAKHIPVSFVSTRYINRIDIPLASNTSLKFDDYFRLGISLPTDLASSTVLETFQTFCGLSWPEKNCRCNIHFTSSPDVLIDCRSFWLDIDCVSTAASPASEAAMWDCISALRERKNEIFEACITSQTRSLFK